MNVSGYSVISMLTKIKFYSVWIEMGLVAGAEENESRKYRFWCLLEKVLDKGRREMENWTDTTLNSKRKISSWEREEMQLDDDKIIKICANCIFLCHMLNC